MKLILNISKNKWLDDVFVFLFSFSVFYALIAYVPTDIQLHIKQIESINLNEVFYPPNFLFYFLVNLFSGFSNEIIWLELATAFLLALATTGKYEISKRIILDKSEGTNYSMAVIQLLAFSLLIVFAIPDFFNLFVLKQMYLGRFVSVVWHNSTTIFLFPFAILLFWQELKMLKSEHTPSLKDLVIVNGLVIINILIKPSFLFVFIPVTCFMIAINFRSYSYKQIAYNLSPVIAGFIFIIIQSVFIYYLQYGSFQKEPSTITISEPFEVLRTWIPYWYIPISLFLSLAFPISAILCFKEILRFKPFVYALYLTIAGILISAFLMEKGPRISHGNFSWQIVVCTYLLMLTSIAYLLPKFLKAGYKSGKLIYLEIVFAIHVLSGILYLTKIFVTSSYM